MARVVLHVGAHKTGTTYLQNLFHLNRGRLAATGIHYPDIGPNTAHHALAAAWIDIPDISERFFRTRSPERLWEDLVARYAAAPGCVFLSAENFSRCFPQEVDMADLARKLSAFEQVQVVYVVRSQAELIQSLWLQVAKSGRTISIYKYVRDALELRRAVGVRIDHVTFYEVLRRGFAPDQITLMDYAQIKRAPGGIGQAFLDFLGAELSVDDLRAPAAADSNISPDPLGYWVATQIAGGGPPSSALVGTVSAVLAETGRRTSLLARHEHVKIESRYRHANDSLVEMVRSTQPEFSFEHPQTPEDLLYREEIPDSAWIKLCARLQASSPLPAGVLTDRFRVFLAGIRRSLR